VTQIKIIFMINKAFSNYDSAYAVDGLADSFCLYAKTREEIEKEKLGPTRKRHVPDGY